MNIIVKLLASLLLLIIAVVAFVYSGIFNVSAQWEDPAVLRWLLVSTREASVEARAKNIIAPATGGEKQIENGFRSYREMCAICHTPPGGKDSPIKLGLNPSPPDLTKEADHKMTDAQLFWVIKNGVRMTGMPAWGVTHDDAEIWDIVAFVKALPEMDAVEYQRLNKQTIRGHGHVDKRDSGNHGKEHFQENVPIGDSHGHTEENNRPHKRINTDNHGQIEQNRSNDHIKHESYTHK